MCFPNIMGCKHGLSPTSNFGEIVSPVSLSLHPWTAMSFPWVHKCFPLHFISLNIRPAAGGLSSALPCPSHLPSLLFPPMGFCLVFIHSFIQIEQLCTFHKTTQRCS